MCGGADEKEPPYKALHDEAVAKGKDFYTDPDTGYMVFTALHHEKRGYCCMSGCRHCPYGFNDQG